MRCASSTKNRLHEVVLDRTFCPGFPGRKGRTCSRFSHALRTSKRVTLPTHVGHQCVLRRESRNLGRTTTAIAFNPVKTPRNRERHSELTWTTPAYVRVSPACRTVAHMQRLTNLRGGFEQFCRCLSLILGRLQMFSRNRKLKLVLDGRLPGVGDGAETRCSTGHIVRFFGTLRRSCTLVATLSHGTPGPTYPTLHGGKDVKPSRTTVGKPILTAKWVCVTPQLRGDG